MVDKLILTELQEIELKDDKKLYIVSAYYRKGKERGSKIAYVNKADYDYIKTENQIGSDIIHIGSLFL